MQKIILPFPVSVNATYRAYGRRIVMTPKAKEYKTRVISQVKQMIRDGELCAVGDVPLCVEFWFYMPDRRRRDLANLDKVLSDALTAAEFWGDDCQMIDQRLVRAAAEEPGAARVEIYVSEGAIDAR